MDGQYVLFQKELPSFIKWLEERGATVQDVTNPPWEMLRFRFDSQLSIVYTNKAGRLSFTGNARSAWAAYKARNNAWNLIQAKVHRPRSKVKSDLVIKLLDRDGSDCFYCLKPMADGQETIEHLVAVAHGGPNHMSNLVLAHPKCNHRAGSLSVMEKIKLRIKALQPSKGVS